MATKAERRAIAATLVRNTFEAVHGMILTDAEAGALGDAFLAAQANGTAFELSNAFRLFANNRGLVYTPSLGFMAIPQEGTS